jgi:hypothetical protein
MVSVYNTNTEQKSERVFSEKVPSVPARIFILQLKKQSPPRLLTMRTKGGTFNKNNQALKHLLSGLFLCPLTGAEQK